MPVSLFGSVEILKKHGGSPLPLQDEALELLTRAAKQVEPIMKERGWRCGKLIEIIPNQLTLGGYNKNRGQLIAIRLRDPRSRNHSSLYPFESVLKVMLHELTHMIHSGSIVVAFVTMQSIMTVPTITIGIQFFVIDSQEDVLTQTRS